MHDSMRCVIDGETGIHDSLRCVIARDRDT